jgi:hypothetical protein
MQQAMEEIIGYLATIDEKLDDVLRAQDDAVRADMIGVGLDIDEAMTIREHAGRVSEVTSPAVVQSGEHVASVVADFHGRLGIESGRQSLEAKRWVDAASEVRDKVLETGAERVDASRRLGNEALDRARSVQGRLSGGIAGRAFRRRGGEDE